MASLSNVIGYLSNIIGDPSNTEPLHRSRQNIEERLGYCHSPEEIQRWHLKKMEFVHGNGDSGRLKPICTNVALHLLHATRQAALLQKWAGGVAFLPENMSARQLLNKALRSLILAFGEFSVVPTSEVFCSHHNMEIVLKYLRMVYEITLVIGEVAFPPNMASQALGYWSEYLDETYLEGFEFDDVDGSRGHWIRDRTLRGVLPPAERTPLEYLPANPSYPVVFRREGPYGPPVVRNAIVPRWEEYENSTREIRWRIKEHDWS